MTNLAYKITIAAINTFLGSKEYHEALDCMEAGILFHRRKLNKVTRPDTNQTTLYETLVAAREILTDEINGVSSGYGIDAQRCLISPVLETPYVWLRIETLVQGCFMDIEVFYETRKRGKFTECRVKLRDFGTFYSKRKRTPNRRRVGIIGKWIATDRRIALYPILEKYNSFDADSRQEFTNWFPITEDEINSLPKFTGVWWETTMI